MVPLAVVYTTLENKSVSSITDTRVISLDEAVQEIQSRKPRIIKRRQQRDHITANFKRSSVYRWIPFENLRIDHTYQRRLQSKKIITMAHRWNPDRAGTLVVNKRSDGFYYIVDGQHRFGALQLIDNRPPRVFCEVYDGLTVEQEARLFHDLDSARDNLTRGASFKALVAAKDPSAIAIVAAAARAGMTVDYERGPVVGNVRAYKTLQDIYRRTDDKTLERILRICNLSWPTSTHAAPEPIMRALEILLVKYPKINDKRLIEVLSRQTPDHVVMLGRQINGTLSSAMYPSVAIVIRNMYNNRMGVTRRLDMNEGLGI